MCEESCLFAVFPQFPGNWAIIAWKTGVSMMSSYVGGADGTVPEVRRAADDSPVKKRGMVGDGDLRLNGCGKSVEGSWKKSLKSVESGAENKLILNDLC
jgi:hypothetical protein